MGLRTCYTQDTHNQCCAYLFCIFFSDTENDVYLEKVYNASNNELVRTNTLVQGAIIQVDATPFRVWYEAHVRFLAP